MGQENQVSPKTGLLVVYTGDGKGKTTAALGMCVRASGYGWKIAIVQFVKGDWKYGELEGIKRLGSNIELKVVGEGCVGICGDKKPLAVHQKAARDGLEKATEKVASGEYRLVILDELNVALSLKLVDRQQVEKLLEARQPGQHLVITGRGAPEWLLDRADLVTEMKEIKHPFKAGLMAQKGIDF